MTARKSAGATTLIDPGAQDTPAAALAELVPESMAGLTSDSGDDGSVDVVTFVIDGETYAFPMEQVKEIIRMPQAVRVPLGPPSLEGLANLRGKVLPIVSLRLCCGLEKVEHDEATRVIVVDGGATLGFVVDRVASVTSVDVALVEPADRMGGMIDGELLSGVIRAQDENTELTKIIDVVRLVATQFALLGGRSTQSGLDSVVQADATAADVEGTDDDTLELVSFVVDGQEYALPIDQVQEIVQAPERVTTVPNVASRVLGVMDLRGRLLPVVSLRQVFGLAQAPLDAHNRIVVVQLPGQGTGVGVVGVVMDTVREVLRVPRDLVADLPEYMAQAGRAQEVEAVCRLEHGKRLVSVLSLERMFARDDLQSALRASADGVDEIAAIEGGDTAVGDLDEVAGEDELLVVFRLAAEEYSVDVDAVQEIIRVPDVLIRVPKALDFVEGLVNLRGAVLPVVDLRTRLALGRCERDERQRIIVLIVNGSRTGFIVDAVTEVLRVSRENLEPAPELSPEQAKMISRVANLAGSQRLLLMLEPDHLLAPDQLDSLIPQQREVDKAILAV